MNTLYLTIGNRQSAIDNYRKANKYFAIKPLLYTLLFLLVAPSNLLAAPDKIFVSKFTAETEELQKLSEAIALDFQSVLQTCKKKFKVLDRRDYNSWIPDEQGENNRNKHQLTAQDVDYHIFGELVYNSTKDYYTIEYGFEEVGTTSIQFIDNIAFDTYMDLSDKDLRQKRIHTRLMKEFELCGKQETQPEKEEKKVEEPLLVLNEPTKVNHKMPRTPKPKKNKTPKPKKVKAPKPKKEKRAAQPKVQGYVKIRDRVRHRFKDLDKDGVPDLIDKERNTPMNVLVNKYGEMISPDTDYIVKKKNNNPDATDKEPKNGEINAVLAEMVPTLPVIQFEYGSTTITEEMYAQLHHLAMILRMYPAIKVVVVANSKAISEPLAYKRGSKVIQFMDDYYKVKAKRFILHYQPVEDVVDNTILFKVMTKATESMPEPE